MLLSRLLMTFLAKLIHSAVNEWMKYFEPNTLEKVIKTAPIKPKLVIFEINCIIRTFVQFCNSHYKINIFFQLNFFLDSPSIIIVWNSLSSRLHAIVTFIPLSVNPNTVVFTTFFCSSSFVFSMSSMRPTHYYSFPYFNCRMDMLKLWLKL